MRTLEEIRIANRKDNLFFNRIQDISISYYDTEIEENRKEVQVYIDMAKHNLHKYLINI